MILNDDFLILQPVVVSFVQTQVGASGALFGLLGLLIIKLFQLRHEVRRPCMEALILFGVALASFGKNVIILVLIVETIRH